mmetsp:Transcript_66517/g.192033  ORF Transcript_66517/g.192033 Transcript_66517/m.192033 type:complete len:216 (+) Transcript_66517:924-1571(+)
MAPKISSFDKGRGRISSKFSTTGTVTFRFLIFVFKTFCTEDELELSVALLSAAAAASAAALPSLASPASSAPVAPLDASADASPSPEPPSPAPSAVSASAAEALPAVVVPFAEAIGVFTISSTVTFSSKIAVALVSCTIPEGSSSNFKETSGVDKFAYLPVAASCTPSRSYFMMRLPFSKMLARKSNLTVIFTVFRARSLEPAGKISKDFFQPSS